MAEFVFSIALLMAMPAALVMTGLFFIFMGLMALWVVGMIIHCVVAIHDTLFVTNRRHGCPRNPVPPCNKPKT
jgi:hypothetical protein